MIDIGEVEVAEREGHVRVRQHNDLGYLDRAGRDVARHRRDKGRNVRSRAGDLLHRGLHRTGDLAHLRCDAGLHLGLGEVLQAREFAFHAADHVERHLGEGAFLGRREDEGLLRLFAEAPHIAGQRRLKP